MITKGLSTFDEIRHSEYHKSNVVGLSNFPYTSSLIRNPIKHAHLETYILTHAATLPDSIFEETQYCYIRDGNGYIVVAVVDVDIKLTPDYFLALCQCRKFVKETVCPCRIAQIPCCNFAILRRLSKPFEH